MALMKNAKTYEVDGTHHVHLDSPELIYHKILDFLNEPNTVPNARL